MRNNTDDIVIPPAMELIKWLDIATRGLGNLAKERIAEEIGAHYGQAYDLALQGGTLPLDADRSALVSLGDPNKALREIRKVYLTAGEERPLRRMIDIACHRRWNCSLGILFGLSYFALSIYSYVTGRLGSTDGLTSRLVLGTFFMFTGMSLWAQCRLLHRRRLRRAVVWLIFQSVPLVLVGCLYLLLFLALVLPGLLGEYIALAAFVLLVAVGARHTYRVVRKVPTVISESEWEALQKKPDLRETFMGRLGRW